MMPDRWLVLSVRAPSETQSHDIVEALLELGGAAIEESGDWLTTYLRPPDDADAFCESVRLRIEGRLDEGVDLRWRWRANEDWAEAWKRGLGPRRIGDRIIVAPSWAVPEEDRERIVIVVDPEMAFGTGEHATTRGVLRLMQRGLRSGDRVLDVGAGTGILGIAAARLDAAEVLGLESDADAVATARANVERNGVSDRVVIREAEVDPDVLGALGAGRYDLIVANILSGVLVPLLPALRDVGAPDGRMILSGILDREAEDVSAAARRARLMVVEEDREEEWWSVLLRRS